MVMTLSFFSMMSGVIVRVINAIVLLNIKYFIELLQSY